MKIYDVFEEAASLGASDVHISAEAVPCIRVNGELRKVGNEFVSNNDMKLLINDILSDNDIEDFYNENEFDGAFELTIQGKPTRIRINLSVENGHIAAALRVLNASIPTIEKLGLPNELKEIALAHQGLFLVTGPTGSGKSTTMAAMIGEANRKRACHIVTIEDPIEYIFDSEKSLIHQREVGRDTRSFNDALRRVVRQDPDIIMIGEMRDKVTAAAALRAAETGHLVLSTLHTNGAARTIDRFLNFFEGEEKQKAGELAAALLGVFSQRLIPDVNNGRVVAYEYLYATDAVRNNIRECRSQMIDNSIQTGAKYGMISFANSLLSLYKKGIISGDTYKEYMRE